MSADITFGTDGWRAVIADGFTFDNVRRVAGAIAVAARTLEPPEKIDRNTLIVGFDRRFLSREFAVARRGDAARRPAIASSSPNAPTPSQTISFTARHRKLLGGVVVTASHNPGEVQRPEVQGVVRRLGAAGDVRRDRREPRQARHARRRHDRRREHPRRLRRRVARAARRRAAEEREARDPPRSDPRRPSRSRRASSASTTSARAHPPRARADRATLIDGIRGEINPSFGGVNPEPIPENLGASRNVMLTGDYDLAICNDGDADRLGILDERGEFVSPQKIISLLALYLVREKKMSGEIVKTFSTTRLDREGGARARRRRCTRPPSASSTSPI